MFENKENDEFLMQKVETIKETLKGFMERENAHFTDVMLLLKGIEDKLSKSEVTIVDPEEQYEEAKEAVIKGQSASTAYLQRTLRIGYARASLLMDLLEERGVIGPADGAKPRDVLLNATE